MVEIERMGPDDWERVRAIRLASLADAPDAFGSTLTREESFIEVDWRKRLQTGATFLASPGSAPASPARPEDIGLVTGIPDPDDPSQAILVGMWVDPAHRASGTGALLVAAVIDWARSTPDHGPFTRLVLDVADANTPATRFYERLGFTPTGHTDTLPPPRTHITEHRRAMEL